MYGIKLQFQKVTTELSSSLINPTSLLTQDLYDFKFYTIVVKVVQAVQMMLDFSDVKEDAKTLFSDLAKLVKEAVKNRPEEDNNDDDLQIKEQIHKFLNKSRPVQNTKERGELYRFLAIREEKQKDNKVFLENINKIQAPIQTKQFKKKTKQYSIQTDLIWVSKIQTNANYQHEQKDYYKRHIYQFFSKSLSKEEQKFFQLKQQQKLSSKYPQHKKNQQLNIKQENKKGQKNINTKTISKQINDSLKEVTILPILNTTNSQMSGQSQSKRKNILIDNKKRKSKIMESIDARKSLKSNFAPFKQSKKLNSSFVNKSSIQHLEVSKIQSENNAQDNQKIIVEQELSNQQDNICILIQNQQIAQNQSNLIESQAIKDIIERDFIKKTQLNIQILSKQKLFSQSSRNKIQRKNSLNNGLKTSRRSSLNNINSSFKDLESRQICVDLRKKSTFKLQNSSLSIQTKSDIKQFESKEQKIQNDLERNYDDIQQSQRSYHTNIQEQMSKQIFSSNRDLQSCKRQLLEKNQMHRIVPINQPIQDKKSSFQPILLEKNKQNLPLVNKHWQARNSAHIQKNLKTQTKKSQNERNFNYSYHEAARNPANFEKLLDISSSNFFKNQIHSEKSSIFQSIVNFKEKINDYLSTNHIDEAELQKNQEQVYKIILDLKRLIQIFQKNKNDQISVQRCQKRVQDCIKLIEIMHGKVCGINCKHLQRFYAFIKWFKISGKQGLKLPTFSIGRKTLNQL